MPVLRRFRLRERGSREGEERGREEKRREGMEMMWIYIVLNQEGRWERVRKSDMDGCSQVTQNPLENI